MSRKTKCSVEGCEKGGQLRRGMCQMHYRRWRRHGDPNTVLLSHHTTMEGRWEANTARLDDCLIWTGAISSDGYGVIYLEKGKTTGAHRYAWERVHGEIPSGKIIDHKCYNRSCVNVKHLRLATRQQNTWNRSGTQKDNTSGARNVYWEIDTQKWRVCIWKNGRRNYFGRFTNIEEAARVAENARKELFGEFAGKG